MTTCIEAPPPKHSLAPAAPHPGHFASAVNALMNNDERRVIHLANGRNFSDKEIWDLCTICAQDGRVQTLIFLARRIGRHFDADQIACIEEACKAQGRFDQLPFVGKIPAI